VERRPELWIVAGPNGAGKSTIASKTLEISHALDPDKICQRVRAQLSPLKLVLGEKRFADATNLLAVLWVERVVASAIRRQRSIAVETVLSTDKYLKHVLRARQLGFEVCMIFVALPEPNDHVRRVTMRMRAGGHAVPEEKIRQRWHRAHDMLQLFVPYLDYLAVWSNAGFIHDDTPDPVLVAEKEHAQARVVVLRRNELPEITRRFG